MSYHLKFAVVTTTGLKKVHSIKVPEQYHDHLLLMLNLIPMSDKMSAMMDMYGYYLGIAVNDGVMQLYDKTAQHKLVTTFLDYKIADDMEYYLPDLRLDNYNNDFSINIELTELFDRGEVSQFFMDMTRTLSDLKTVKGLWPAVSVYITHHKSSTSGSHRTSVPLLPRH